MTRNRKIPATLVSQHPDHASKPYWHTGEFINTHDEIEECYLTFAELGASEYKWDWEGKWVDESVVEKLLSDHHQFFAKNPLGNEIFLTFRLPNPKTETEFRLSRAFLSILTASNMAEHFGLHTPPLFEVILPMTESAEEMIEIREAFREMAGLRHPLHKFSGGLSDIEMIPLFEQAETIMDSDKIIAKYLDLSEKKFGSRPKYLRPYVARSDPALNSGLVPTVIAIKIALSRYRQFEENHSIPLYPIIGSASLPFRGGLTPLNVESFVKEYAGVRTALLQSAFRYDYPKSIVISAIKKIEQLLPREKAIIIPQAEEKKLRQLVKIFEQFYRPTIEGIAEYINTLASILPKRRERVQHTGLFGYSRGVGQVKLPRAITFTGSLYSLGVPPEIIGTGRGIRAMQEQGQLDLIERYYLNLKNDLKRAGGFVNKEVLDKLAKADPAWRGVQGDILAIEKYLGVELGPKNDEERSHYQIVDEIYANLDNHDVLPGLLSEAAKLRKSLG